MNKLSVKERAQIVSCLIEGCSMRSAVRMTGFAKRTIARFQTEIGEACARYHERVMMNLPCKVLQVDEVWSFTYCKQKNAVGHLREKPGVGDTWTWVAICAETKLVPCWHVGGRTANDAYWFIHDLQARLKERVQLTSDGLKAYVQAVESAFGSEIDYAQLVKLYGSETPVGDARYSPPVCTGTRKSIVQGQPDTGLISTSYIERQNLTMRMAMRRFTRLTNAFSKKFENHCHAVALHFLHYNFARIHQTLRITPAMAAGVTDHVWSLEEIVGLMD